jgi:hypothetical protein
MIEQYGERIGELSVQALEKGGEVLLDRVTLALGVASRHLARVRAGELSLVRGVVNEIEDSFHRAEKLLELVK